MGQNGDCFTWIAGAITSICIYEMSFWIDAQDVCTEHESINRWSVNGHYEVPLTSFSHPTQCWFRLFCLLPLFDLFLPFYFCLSTLLHHFPTLCHTLHFFTSQSPEPAEREVSQCGSFTEGEGEFRVLWAGQDAASARGHHQPAGQGLGYPADH